MHGVMDWITVLVFLAICAGAVLANRGMRNAPLLEDDQVTPERPFLTRPVVKGLSLSDRLRRKAAAQAKRDADRVLCQLAAHDFEFREAREADHVR